MLVRFSVENFKSFKEEAVLNMVASSSDKVTRWEENTFHVEKFKLDLLRSIVIYGANASGKSKLLEAMRFMRNFVIESSKEGQIDDPIRVDPFRLSTETLSADSSFEMVFIHNDVMYRYGFSVNRAIVSAEWLYRKMKKKEVEIFYRDNQDFDYHDREFKAKDIIKNERVRPNALLISVAASFNDEMAKDIVGYFKLVGNISGIQHEGYEGFSIHRLNEENNKREILDFLAAADLGIEDLQANKLSLDDLPDEMPDELKKIISDRMKEDTDSEYFGGVNTFRNVFDEKLRIVKTTSLKLDEDESSGTRKFFALSGPILDSLMRGRILAIDEMANKLHPLLACKLVQLFNQGDTNAKNSQLIFTTHDTNLLDSGLFRRDQIWFTEKNRYGASTFYSLADFKTGTVRKEDNFEKKYIEGRFGAIPYLGDFSFNIEDPSYAE